MGYQIAANPTPGQPPVRLFPDGAIRGRRHELSPVDDQVLVYDWPYIGVGTVGDSASVQRILEVSGTLFGMEWLRDGSGLLGGEERGGNTYANIWRYTLGATEVFNLTNFSDENRGYAADPGVSPDGTEVVYIYAPTYDAQAEIRIMDINGDNDRSLGVSGLYPDWGIPGTLPNPTATPTLPNPTATPTPAPPSNHQIYVPTVRR